MKKILHLLALIISFTACMDEPIERFTSEEISQDVVTEKKDIDTLIIEKFLNENEENPFSWRDLSDEQLWAAYQYANNTLIIGFDEEKDYESQKKEVLKLVQQFEGSKENDFIFEEMKNLQTIFLKVKKKETLLALKNLPSLAESFEIGYQLLDEEKTEGSFQKKPSNNTTLEAKMNSLNLSQTRLYGSYIQYPTRLSYHGIDKAWQKGLSGKNITVAVIDNGILKDDNQFGQNAWDLNGINPRKLHRKLERHSRFKICGGVPICDFFSNYTSAWDDLKEGHGTRMLQTLGSPMGKATKNSQGQPTGVAFAANLVAVKGTHNIFTDILNNAIGVGRAFDYLAGRNDVKIISISNGGITPWNFIKRGVRKCTKRNKLVFAAAGTLPKFLTDSFSFLNIREITLFPASMKETIACTGTKKGGDTWCNDCHGTADFTVEFDENQALASSSQSTATVAGIAALIWSDNLSLSANEVLKRMKKSSEFGYSKRGWKGHGRIFMEKYFNLYGSIK